MTKLLLNPDSYRLTATVERASNGDQAKSAPVTVVANTGSPVDYPPFGAVVWDLATMNVKARIPLDYNHEDNSIGYLNKFDTDNGELVCTGAVTPAGDQEAQLLVDKMTAGVPYQASIESHNGTYELIDEGEPVTVNGKDMVGPMIVVRNWDLAAVAICKFGKDSDTSTSLAASKQKKENKQKVLFISTLNRGSMEMRNTLIDKEQVKTVDAVEVKPVVVEPVAEVKPVEEVKEVVEAPKAVDAIAKEAEVVVKDEVVEPALAASVDARAEFKRFMLCFGNDKASEFYAKGLSFEDSQTEYISAIKSENEELKKKLSAKPMLDRGADKPVNFQASDTNQELKKTGMAAVIKVQGKTKK